MFLIYDLQQSPQWSSFMISHDLLFKFLPLPRNVFNFAYQFGFNLIKYFEPFSKRLNILAGTIRWLLFASNSEKSFCSSPGSSFASTEISSTSLLFASFKEVLCFSLASKSKWERSPASHRFSLVRLSCTIDLQLQKIVQQKRFHQLFDWFQFKRKIDSQSQVEMLYPVESAFLPNGTSASRTSTSRTLTSRIY